MKKKIHIGKLEDHKDMTVTKVLLRQSKIKKQLIQYIENLQPTEIMTLGELQTVVNRIIEKNPKRKDTKLFMRAGEAYAGFPIKEVKVENTTDSVTGLDIVIWKWKQ